MIWHSETVVVPITFPTALDFCQCHQLLWKYVCKLFYIGHISKHQNDTQWNILNVCLSVIPLKKTTATTTTTSNSNVYFNRKILYWTSSMYIFFVYLYAYNVVLGDWSEWRFSSAIFSKLSAAGVFIFYLDKYEIENVSLPVATIQSSVHWFCLQKLNSVVYVTSKSDDLIFFDNTFYLVLFNIHLIHLEVGR